MNKQLTKQGNFKLKLESITTNTNSGYTNLHDYNIRYKVTGQYKLEVRVGSMSYWKSINEPALSKCVAAERKNLRPTRKRPGSGACPIGDRDSNLKHLQ